MLAAVHERQPPLQPQLRAGHIVNEAHGLCPAVVPAAGGWRVRQLALRAAPSSCGDKQQPHQQSHQSPHHPPHHTYLHEGLGGGFEAVG
jgi:hypothetical protein